MTVPRDGSYIWVTWITGLLAADKHCEWAAWFRAHFQGFAKVPSDFDLAAWKAAHGEMVRARATELRGEGYTVQLAQPLAVVKDMSYPLTLQIDDGSGHLVLSGAATANRSSSPRSPTR